MKVSAFLLPIMANTALAAIAVTITENNGGTVSILYRAEYWTGPPTDDEWVDQPGYDSCDIQAPNGQSCDVGGYKVTLNKTGGTGCHEGVDVDEATIENSSGDKIENVKDDDRCEEFEYCGSGAVGGTTINGYQCDF